MPFVFSCLAHNIVYLNIDLLIKEAIEACQSKEMKEVLIAAATEGPPAPGTAEHSAEVQSQPSAREAHSPAGTQGTNGTAGTAAAAGSGVGTSGVGAGTTLSPGAAGAPGATGGEAMSGTGAYQQVGDESKSSGASKSKEKVAFAEDGLGGEQGAAALGMFLTIHS